MDSFPEGLKDSIIASIPDAILIIDRSGIVLGKNQNASQQSPFLENAITGSSIYDILDIDNRNLVRLSVESLLLTNEPQVGEGYVLHPDGYKVFFEVNFNLIGSEAVSEPLICIFVRDVTTEKSFQYKNQKAVNSLHNLIAKANAVIFEIDKQRYVVEWNEKTEEVTGEMRAGVLGRRLEEIFSKEESIAIAEKMSDLEKYGSINSWEIELKRDVSKTLLLNATPKLNEQGQLVGALFVGHDISELVQYRRSLELQVMERTRDLRSALESEKALLETKERLVAIASHEVKTPLNAVDVSLRTLAKNAPENVQVPLKQIITSVQHIRGVLEDVLEKQTPTQKIITPRWATIDLEEFIDSIFDDVRKANQSSHALEKKYSAQNSKISSDEKLLRSIFINIIGNAVKYSPGKSMIRIEIADQDNDKISVSVRDFGIGIDPGQVNEIFEQFRRGSNVGSIKGTGLGLSIVRRALQSLEADVAVKSELGNGSEFTVTLPKRSSQK